MSTTYEEMFRFIQGRDKPRDLELLEKYNILAHPDQGIYADMSYWESKNVTCDSCGIECDDKETNYEEDGHTYLYDAKMLGGYWAVCCSECWENYGAAGHRLGTGLGQKYQLQDDGRFKKVQG